MAIIGADMLRLRFLSPRRPEFDARPSLMREAYRETAIACVACLGVVKGRIQ